jgi:replicative DNA helicase
MIDRVPPQSIETEQSILASCLLYPNDTGDAVDMLRPADFYRTAHQSIFETICHLHQRKQPTDLLSTSNRLKDIDKLDEVGGATYLAVLTNECPIAMNVPHYCKILKTKAAARSLIAAAHRAIEACHQADDEKLSAVIDQTQTQILNINMGTDSAFVPMSDLTVDSIDRWEQLNQGKAQGIMTGFSELDMLTGGFRGSKLIIVAARPRIGKTALMCNMARAMAKAGHRVGIFSIEMDAGELDDRFTASETGINSMRLSAGTGPDYDEWKRINECAAKKCDWPIWIDDTGGLSIQELKRRARKARKMGLEIIFIDQLSKITGGKGRSEYEQRSFVVNELAILKKDVRIPIVLLAQVGRKSEDRGNRLPYLSDLKSTGSLEEDADIILIGHRDFEYTRSPEDEHKAVWHLAKHRGGPCRVMEFCWHGKTCVFFDPPGLDSGG